MMKLHHRFFEESDNGSASESSESPEDENTQLLHSQSSEAETTEDFDEDDVSNNPVDKNNYLWSTQCPEANRRRGAENIIKNRAGPASCVNKDT